MAQYTTYTDEFKEALVQKILANPGRSVKSVSVEAGARKEKACELLDVTVRTIQRWERGSVIIEDQRKYRKQTPMNKLRTDDEITW